MSINIHIDGVTKRYGDSIVISNLSVDIQKGEFFTLLGPSGCGKTTLLRMIAGFNSIEQGDILFNERRINDIEPAKRRIGMVFQNYAIFPHLSVRKNVEFGLRNMDVPRSEVSDRAQEYIELVQIGKWADQMPDRLSGGQQQRVALARALVTSPDVLLMDEPLSNLDAKLRVEMREAIREIQKSVGTTTVYVTHDQEEAMAVSDRIAVMKDGVIQHLGTPRELYHRPSNIFVSTFIGRTNLIDATLTAGPDGARLEVAGAVVDIADVEAPAASTSVTASVRPEQFLLDPAATSGIAATVLHGTFLGMNTHYMLELADGSQVEAVQESEYEEMLAEGAQVFLDIKRHRVNIFSADGMTNLRDQALGAVGVAS